MPSLPYKDTEILRATVDRNCRLVLPKYENDDPNCYRMVQILTDTAIYIAFAMAKLPNGVEVPVDPEGSAGGRDYLMGHVPASVGVVAPFAMRNDQELYMMSAVDTGTDHASMALATLIVQHWRAL